MRVLLRILFFILCLFQSVFINVQAGETCNLIHDDNYSKSVYEIINDSENYYLIINNNNYEISVLSQSRDKDFYKGKNSFCKTNSSIELNKLAEQSHYKLSQNHKISSYLNELCIRAP